MIVVWSD
jgi:hypothetical protein